ncbi:hypothetical protein CVT25_007479 [Psilocybe cyanescens]|uniref:Uncharacterized protein n=1 Tax=Psilocybe cyanescens TaxID=93625 RepID=A0A409XVR3_PSICY|nr:hypothetical protein CVT25_007479 [Psilocybe cyanescens]
MEPSSPFRVPGKVALSAIMMMIVPVIINSDSIPARSQEKRLSRQADRQAPMYRMMMISEHTQGGVLFVSSWESVSDDASCALLLLSFSFSLSLCRHKLLLKDVADYVLNFTDYTCCEFEFRTRGQRQLELEAVKQPRRSKSGNWGGIWDGISDGWIGVIPAELMFSGTVQHDS